MSALAKLREVIEIHNLDGYIQPVHDAFMNEYPPACFRRAEWLSGFTGSAGSVAVLASRAALFTDGRYTLQAKAQVSAQDFELHNSAVLTQEKWLAEHAPAGGSIGYDSFLFTRDMITRLESALAVSGVRLVPCENLVDAIWQDRPPAPASALFIHDDKYAGQSALIKREAIGKAVQAAGAQVALLTAPDSVCWLLNIRARDIEHTPLLLACALVDVHGAVELFVEPERCDGAVRAHLGEAVSVYAPQRMAERLQALSARAVLCDPSQVPAGYLQRLAAAGARVVQGRDPCLLPKAMKNSTEVQGIRAAHIRDGVALAKLLCWLDGEVERRGVSEMEVAEVLRVLRAEHPLFLEPSFNTIAGSGPNGAIVHYRATPESNRTLGSGELFLLDSGGQYPDGTTDVTRTVAIGLPSPEMRDRFTRVLKGHIAVATATFPEGTCGSQLDVLARRYLWEAELDYDHGTGHGVGHFLNVHEGPQRISKRGGDAALMPGMVVSNEPGYYQAGAFGIRIENLVVVVEARNDSAGKRWFSFDTLTCAPIDTRLIDTALMSAAEKEWLNAYHRWVSRMLSLHLEGEALAWLEQACRAI